MPLPTRPQRYCDPVSLVFVFFCSELSSFLVSTHLGLLHAHVGAESDEELEAFHVVGELEMNLFVSLESLLVVSVASMTRSHH